MMLAEGNTGWARCSPRVHHWLGMMLAACTLYWLGLGAHRSNAEHLTELEHDIYRQSQGQLNKENDATGDQNI